jgi:hypothetical protein
MKSLLLLLVAVATVRAVTVSELNCATSFEIGDVAQADRNPQATLETAVTNFIVRLPVAYRDIYYLQMINTSITVRSFTASGGPATGVKSFSDLVDVMTQLPGQVVDCGTTRGCDGFVLGVLAFRRLFPRNATHYVMTYQVRWYTNTSAVHHSSQRRLLGIPPDSAILVGTSDLESAEFNMTAALENQALATPASSSDDTWWIVLSAVGGTVGLLLIIVLCMIYIRSSRERKETKVSELQPLQVPVQGPYGHHYSGRHTLGRPTRSDS